MERVYVGKVVIERSAYIVEFVGVQRFDPPAGERQSFSHGPR